MASHLMNEGGDKMATNQRAKTSKVGGRKTGPHAKVKAGSAVVPIYQSKSGDRVRYAVSFYRDGKRQRKMFSTLEKAKKEALFVAQRIQVTGSPLWTHQWMLLSLGLAEIPLPTALIVMAWLFFLAWRGLEGFSKMPAWGHEPLQLLLVVVTLVALGIFIMIVNTGLLGDLEMFILANGSSRHALNWYQAHMDGVLTEPLVLSVSN